MMILSDCWATNWRNWITVYCIRLTLPKAEIRQWIPRQCSRSWPLRIPKTFIHPERLKPLVNGISTSCGCWPDKRQQITVQLPVSARDSWQTPARIFFIRWQNGWKKPENYRKRLFLFLGQNWKHPPTNIPLSGKIRREMGNKNVPESTGSRISPESGVSAKIFCNVGNRDTGTSEDLSVSGTDLRRAAHRFCPWQREREKP